MQLETQGILKNVLIIDNEPFILDIFSKFLSDRGVNTQTALSNDDALKYMKNETFDLILGDVHMKGMSFSEFLGNVKHPDGKHKNVPVIAVTGVPSEITPFDKQKLAGVLEKPFTPEEMLAYINQVILKISIKKSLQNT
jgi:DNA-binding response OmpR family regulator